MHTYKTIQVGSKIRSIEKDCTQSKEDLQWAKLIIFCYPVYTFIVPAQLHRFIEENCADMNMKYIRGLSADMEDLLSKKGRKEAVEFFEFVMWNVRNGFTDNAFMAQSTNIKIHAADAPRKSSYKTSKKIALVTDIDVSDDMYHNLDTMIKRFTLRYPGDVIL